MMIFKEDRQCVNCDETFEVVLGGRGRPRKFCSGACRQRSYVGKYVIPRKRSLPIRVLDAAKVVDNRLRLVPGTEDLYRAEILTVVDWVISIEHEK